MVLRSVMTTPLICGDQASLTIRIRMGCLTIALQAGVAVTGVAVLVRDSGLPG